MGDKQQSNECNWLKSTRRKACFTSGAKHQVFTPAKQVFTLAEGFQRQFVLGQGPAASS